MSDNNTVWKCIHKTTDSFEADVIMGNLKSKGIPAVIVNKKDSSLLAYVFGTAEINVPEDRAEEALKYLNENNLKDGE